MTTIIFQGRGGKDIEPVRYGEVNIDGPLQIFGPSGSPYFGEILLFLQDEDLKNYLNVYAVAKVAYLTKNFLRTIIIPTDDAPLYDHVGEEVKHEVSNATKPYSPMKVVGRDSLPIPYEER